MNKTFTKVTFLQEISIVAAYAASITGALSARSYLTSALILIAQSLMPISRAISE